MSYWLFKLYLVVPAALAGVGPGGKLLELASRMSAARHHARARCPGWALGEESEDAEREAAAEVRGLDTMAPLPTKEIGMVARIRERMFCSPRACTVCTALYGNGARAKRGGRHRESYQMSLVLN